MRCGRWQLRLGRVLDSAIGTGWIVAVERWIGSNGLQVAAAFRESYWTDFTAADGGHVVFDVAYPVR